MKFKMKILTGTALPIVAGAVAAKLVKNMAGKMIKNDKLRAAAPILIGILLAGNKKTANVGYGMIAVGGADLAGTLVPSLAGIEEMDLSGLFDELSGDGGYEMNGPLNDDLNLSGDGGDYEMNGPLNDEIGAAEYSEVY